MSAALPGCSSWLHADAIGLCRSVIPVLNAQTTKIVVTSTDATRMPNGLVVTIGYGAVEPTEPAERRTISCIFDEDGPAGRLDLVNLATEDGPVGDVRLYLIKRHWLAKAKPRARGV